jgi:hypothetical protein
MAMTTYTLYHVTERTAAVNILANGFALGKTIELSSSRWKNGTKGDTAIKVVIDLDDEFVPGTPGENRLYHVDLEPETLNTKAQLSILDPTERDPLRQGRAPSF